LGAGRGASPTRLPSADFESAANPHVVLSPPTSCEKSDAAHAKIRGFLLKCLNRSLTKQLLGALDKASVGGYG
jgi:hypothetical protein